MSILHGSWIKTETTSYLFIWGEIWRSASEIEAIETTKIPPLHPLCCNIKELVALCKSQKLRLNFDVGKCWKWQSLSLPTCDSYQGTVIAPVLANQ